MTDRTLHAAPPIIPGQIYQQLMKVAEANPILKIVAAHIDETKSLVMGHCVEGTVTMWTPKAPVFEFDLPGLKDMVIGGVRIEEDEIAVFSVERTPTPGLPLAPIIGRIH